MLSTTGRRFADCDERSLRRLRAGGVARAGCTGRRRARCRRICRARRSWRSAPSCRSRTATSSPTTWSRTRSSSSTSSRTSTKTARPARVYLGVGPEQNFTYIAALKPAMVFIVDVRRGNLQLHLMYKALFELSADRADFVARLFSKERPAGLTARLVGGRDLRGLRKGRDQRGALQEEPRGDRPITWSRRAGCR